VAIRLPDGSIKLHDGRIIYANSLILGQDLAEVIPLFSPPPVWPFVGGGGGGSGPQGPAGPAGSGGGGAGFQGAQGGFGPQGFQGTNPGPQGDLGPQGNQGVAGTGSQGNQGSIGPQGSLGPQGNQGVAGTGAQGNQGAAGPQGNQGDVGAQGNQGATGAGTQGPQGDIGPQGTAGAGVQGAQGFQGLLNPDIFAPTRVVDAGGTGTDLTIASALAALPAEGGSIYVKQGTYAIVATLTIPAGKPVLIKGSGNATVIDLGANAIPAFTVPTGATTNTPIIFDSFKVTGNETAGQTFVEYDDANGLCEVFMQNIVTTGVETTINSNSAASASSTPGQDDPRFHMLRCRIRPCATDNSVILHNSSFGLPRCWMTEVEFIGDSLFAIPGGRTAPLFGRVADDTWFGDCYLDSCEMSIGTGESDFATFECFNSTLWNNDNVNTTVEYFLFGSFEGLNPGTIRDSAMRGIWFQAFEAGSSFYSNWIQDCPLDLFGAGIVIGDNNIIEVRSPWPVATDFGIRVQNETVVIRNNRFRFRNATPSMVVDLEAPSTVTGNDFSENHPNANGSIFIDNGDCIITSNRFTFAPTTGPNVREINGPTIYDNNNRLFTNKTAGGPIVDPVIPLGNGDTVDGTVDFNAAGSVGGTATNSLVVWYRNPFGLAKLQGYIHNTGANNITVREQYISQNEGTFTRSTVIAAGAKLVLDPYNFTGFVGLDNQVVDYRVDVSGTTISWHTYFPGVNCVTGT